MYLKERLEESLQESSRVLTWIDKDVLQEGLRIGLLEAERLNEDQGDETFKSVVIFQGRKMVYVGERV